jgi:hypothetical protein
MLSGNYKLNSPGVISDQIDGEVLVIDLTVGHYFRIKGSTTHLWDLLISGINVPEIFDSCKNFPEKKDEIQTHIEALISHNLIVPNPENPSGSEKIDSWDFETFSIEKFTDLEDILGLDPIHEIDPEKGWPESGAPKQTN